MPEHTSAQPRRLGIGVGRSLFLGIGVGRSMFLGIGVGRSMFQHTYHGAQPAEQTGISYLQQTALKQSVSHSKASVT